MTIRLFLRNEIVEVAIALAAFVLLLLLSSCAARTGSPELQAQQASQATKSDRLNSELAQRSSSVQTNRQIQGTFKAADYKIGPEDLLEITVFEAKELNATVRVSATGFIKLPLIDKVEAGGMTVLELEQALSKKLETYLNEPVVAVFVREYRSQQIAVFGSVKNPGVFSVLGQRYLLDLLSMAGGLNPEASDVCIVQRGTAANPGETQANEQIVVDLNELLINGRIELNIPLTSGDVVHVPKSGIFFIDGAVQAPGSYSLKGRMTVIEAVTTAKGFAFEAVKSEIAIYRDKGKSEREMIMVDYEAILQGRARDVEIRDKDIIVVAASGLKTFLKGFAGTINFGAFSLGRGAFGF